MKNPKLFWEYIADDIYNKFQKGHPFEWEALAIKTFIKEMNIGLKEILKDDEKKAKICGVTFIKGRYNFDIWSFSIDISTFKRYFKYKTSTGKEKVQNCFAIFLGYESANQYMVFKANNIEKFQKKVEESKATIYDKYLTLPPPKPNFFIGRAKELEEVHQMLQENANVVLVNGMGGIGKTALAQTYWDSYQHSYQHLVWITVSSNIQTAIVNSSLTLNLNIQTYEGQSEKEKFNLIWHKLTNLKGDKLLVIDNANDIDDLEKYHFNLPNWHVLLTSRSNIEKFKTYLVGILPHYYAKKLFIKYYPMAQDQIVLLEKLLEAIGYHTLTIEVLAKNLKESRKYNLLDLVNNLQEKGLLYPDKNTAIPSSYMRGNHPYPHIISAMFDIRPLNSYAQWLLLQFSVLPSDYISDQEMSRFLQVNSQTEQQFENTLDELVKKGWVMTDGNIDIDKRRYRVHEVIQEVVREKIKPTYDNCALLLDFFNKELHNEINEGFLAKTLYAPFAEKLLYSLKEKKHTNTIELYAKLGLLNYDLGYHSKAEKLYLKAINTLKNTEPVDKLNLSKLYNLLAPIYRDLSTFQKSIDFHQKAISILKKNYPNELNTLATVYNDTAMTYYSYSNLEKAFYYQKKAIEIQEKVLPNNDLHLAYSYQNLGLMYGKLGDNEKSLVYNEKSIEILEKDYPNNNALAKAYTTKGAIYEKMKNYTVAIEFHQKALCIQEEILNAGNPDFAISYNNIGITYYFLGQKDKCLEYLEKSLAIKKKVFGEKNIETAISYDNIGYFLREVGKLEISLQYHIKAIAIQKNILQPQSPELGISYMNIANTYYQSRYLIKERLFLAEKYNTKAIFIFQHNFPSGHYLLTNAYRLKKQISEGFIKMGLSQNPPK